MSELLDYFLHAQKNLSGFIEHYGVWIYALLFVIVFCETGLVVTPFLPGDSLLFAVGALSAQGMMSVKIVAPLLFCAAILGNTTNYAIGSWIGPRVFHFESGWFFRKDYLMKAHAFYEKYGGRAVSLAQFMPIVRTFAPFVAGVGSMTYRKFIAFNLLGAFLWVGIFVGGGYFFGELEIVKNNMELVIVGIIVVSVLPIVFEFAKARLEKNSRRG
ncbi:MAG: DedA family protein [Verrucomicrobiae bacterium]